MSRLLAVGDIHGCQDAFRAVLSALDLQPSDTLVLLGDYIDRGPASRGVLDDVMALQGRLNLVPLRGNHEQMMRGARFSYEQWMTWMLNGGHATMRSFGSSGDYEKLRRDVPKAYWKLLDEQLLDWWEFDTYLFAHAGIEPNLPMEEQSLAALQWMNFRDVQPHMSGKRLVCGHTAASTIRMKDHACCIDTSMGKSPAGLLTAIDLTNRVALQSDTQGRVRHMKLD